MHVKFKSVLPGSGRMRQFMTAAECLFKSVHRGNRLIGWCRSPQRQRHWPWSGSGRAGWAGGAVKAVRPSRGPGEAATGPPTEARTCVRAAGRLQWPAGPLARVVRSEPVRPCVRAVCDSAGSGSKVGTNCARRPPRRSRRRAYRGC